jgi:hypothetical protein
MDTEMSVAFQKWASAAERPNARGIAEDNHGVIDRHGNNFRLAKIIPSYTRRPGKANATPHIRYKSLR